MSLFRPWTCLNCCFWWCPVLNNSRVNQCTSWQSCVFFATIGGSTSHCIFNHRSICAYVFIVGMVAFYILKFLLKCNWVDSVLWTFCQIKYKTWLFQLPLWTFGDDWLVHVTTVHIHFTSELPIWRLNGLIMLNFS